MKENDNELINSFLDNELSVEEAELFRKRYAEDPEFAREVNQRSRVHISLDALSRVSRKTMAEKPFLIKIHPGMTSYGTGGRKPRGWRKVLPYAAVLVVRIAAGTVFFLTGRPKPGPAELYTAYYKPPDPNAIPTPRGGPDLTDFSFLLEEIDRGMQAATDTLKTPDEYFYFGVYCMNQERFTEAIYAFSVLAGSSDRYYRDDGQWYLGLCYLKLNRMDDAIRIFSEIALTKGHAHQEESRELLGKLK